MTPPEGNVTQGLADFARKAPDRPALIFGRRQWTYAQLEEAVRRAAALFVRHGLERGDVLPLSLTDQVGTAIALLATMRMGATTMPLSPGLSDRQRRSLISAAGARFQVVADPAMAETGLHAIRFDLTQPGEGPITDTRPDAPARLIVGSGSTGEPLLIPLGHDTIRSRNAAEVRCLGFEAGQRFMLVSPVFFASPTDWLLATVPQGLTCVLWDSAMGFKAAIEAARPDYLHLTVLHAHGLLTEAKRHPNFDLARLKQVSIGASPVSETLRNAMRTRLKAPLFINYGTNETGTLSVAFPADLDRAPDTVGQPIPGVELQIVDSRDHPVREGVIGEIRVKGPGVFDRYRGDAPNRFRDGWFYPGDRAKRVGDQIVHCGRADQMMIADGLNIYPAEIEHCLEQHPAVNEAAAFSLPDAVHGDVPICAVSLNPGARLPRGALMSFAKQELGPHRPRRIVLVERLPRNAQGKLVRSALTQLLEEAVRRRRPE